MIDNIVEQLYENVLTEVNELLDDNKVEDAKEKIQKLVESIEESGYCKENETTTFKNFYEQFEEDLFHYYNKTSKNIERPNINLNNLYLSYGSILLELKEVEEAQYYLEKAVYYNPVNARTNFEYIETFRYNNDMETFYMKTKDFMKYCFTLDDFSRCLRNCGFCFTEMGIYDVAYACYMMSIGINGVKHPNAIQELNYIKENYDGPIPTVKEGIELVKEYDVEYNINEQNIDLALSNYKYFVTTADNEAAVYYLQKYYEMTLDQQALQLIEQIKGGK